MSFSREIKKLIWHQNEGSISGEEYKKRKEEILNIEDIFDDTQIVWKFF